MERFAVIGLGLFGSELARTLAAAGAAIVAVDRDLERVELFKDIASRAIRMDARDPEALREHRIHEVEVAIVCMAEDFEAAELTTVALRELGAREIITRGTTKERVQILEALGPDRVISPNVGTARRLALTLVTPRLHDIVSLRPNLSTGLRRIGSARAGGILGKVKLKGLHVAALLREGLEEPGAPPGVLFAPPPDTILQRNDLLVVLGTEESVLGRPAP